MVAHACHKIPKAKRAGSVAQVVEYLPTKCKVLSSNTSVEKNSNRAMNMIKVC
jgi:hypothetical protein